MKISKKIGLGLVALVLTVGLAFSLSAFKPKPIADLAYQYTLSTDAGVMSASNWTPITYNPNPEDCEAEGELVCVVQFKENQFSDITAFLANYANAAAVNSSIYAKRHKEPESH